MVSLDRDGEEAVANVIKAAQPWVEQRKLQPKKRKSRKSVKERFPCKDTARSLHTYTPPLTPETAIDY